MRFVKILHYWQACWYSGCAAWPETQTCQSQVYGSSSGHPYISPARETQQELLCSLYYLHACFKLGNLLIFLLFIVQIDINIIQSTHLTCKCIGILQRLINLTVLQVILWSLSFHLLVKLLFVFHLFWTRVELVDNNENNAGRVSHNSNPKIRDTFCHQLHALVDTGNQINLLQQSGSQEPEETDLEQHMPSSKSMTFYIR